MAETISQIDRIRAVDVPWRMYLIMFIILMILLGLITGGLFQALRLPTTFMILAMVSLVVLMIIAFLVITFYGFKFSNRRRFKMRRGLPPSTMRSKLRESTSSTTSELA